MAIELWELAAADDNRRFSPFCWRIRLALRHKGLTFVTHPWRMSDKPALAFSGQGRVPVLNDDGRIVFDSWTIAEYLDETYADRPSLLGPKPAHPLAHFVADWAEMTVQAALFPIVITFIHAAMNDTDKAYFRATREKRLGQTLEAYGADPEAKIPALRAALAPMRRTLARQSFVSGAEPAWADYAIFGAFQWARCVCPLRLLAPDDPVFAWRERMLDLYGGEARAAVGYPV